MLVIDEQFLIAISLVAKHQPPKHIWLSKDVDIVRRLMTPYTIGDVTSKQVEILHAPPTNIEPLAYGLNSFAVAVRRLSAIVTNIVIPVVIEVRLVYGVSRITTSFHLGLGAQGIISSIVI